MNVKKHALLLVYLRQARCHSRSLCCHPCVHSYLFICLETGPHCVDLSEHTEILLRLLSSAEVNA